MVELNEVPARVLKDGKVQKVLDVEDARATAHSFLLATNSLLPYSLSVRELGNRKEMTEKVSRIADLLLEGVVRR